MAVLHQLWVCSLASDICKCLIISLCILYFFLCEINALSLRVGFCLFTVCCGQFLSLGHLFDDITQMPNLVRCPLKFSFVSLTNAEQGFEVKTKEGFSFESYLVFSWSYLSVNYSAISCRRFLPQQLRYFVSFCSQ